MKAIHSMIGILATLVAAARTNGAQNGNTIDLANTQGNAVVFSPGVVTDGTHAPKIQDSPDGTTWTDVTAANQVGTLANLATNTMQKCGYIGGQRYLRAVVTGAGATTGAVYSAHVITNGNRKQPVP